MGFSVVGTIIAVLSILPSIIFFAFFPPVNKSDGAQSPEPLSLTLLERVGQTGCLIILVISHKWFDMRSFDIWLALVIACLLVYYGLWIRYFSQGRHFVLLYKPFLFVPVPMAVFPIAAFGFAAVWGQSIWLGIAAALFAAGHIPISLLNVRRINDTQTQKRSSEYKV